MMEKHRLFSFLFSSVIIAILFRAWHNTCNQTFDPNKFPYTTLKPASLENCDLSENNFLNVIDQQNITVLKKPSADHFKDVVFVILTAPGNYEKRQRTREQLQKFSSKISWIFLIGTSTHDNDKKLAAEISENGDFLQISVRDSYDNLAYKTLASFLWLWKHDQSGGRKVKWIVKIDDDLRLELATIIQILEDKDKAGHVGDEDNRIFCSHIYRNLVPETRNGTQGAKW